MGPSQLSTAGTAALILAALAGPVRGVIRAQGPVYREAWANLHLELLRERVQVESRGRDRATLQKVAELLAEPGQGEAWRPAARALAHLRGVACDDAFLLRATLGAFVLPEVVDPLASRADCHSLHATMQLPVQVPVPGAVGFRIEVFDATGARVHESMVGPVTSVADLRMAEASGAVPGAELADGRYRLRLSVLIDGAPPRTGDPRLEHTFHVLRGYERRATAVGAGWRAAAAASPPTTRALLTGIGRCVERAFTGEPFDGESQAVVQLERAEQALQNIADGKSPLAGLSGDVTVGLPTGGDAVLDAVVRLPAEGATRLPLLVVCGAAPALDVEGRRPLTPSTRSAAWVQRRVGDLSLAGRAHIVWLQSPGPELPFAPALSTGLAALHELLPTDGRTVLVLELEAAVALCYAPDLLRRTAGVVLVGAGALALPMLKQLAELPLLGVTLSGHRSSDGLRLTADLAAGKYGTVECRFALAPELPRPWTFGAAAAAAEVGAFLASLPARPR